MTAHVWFQEALKAWSAATGQAFAIHTYDRERPHRALGEWWKDGDDWCLHLAPTEYATFINDLDAIVRRTLTWSLQTMQTEQSQQPEALVLAYLAELLRGTAGTSTSAGTAAPPLHWTGPAPWRDGCFVLVDANASGRRSRGEISLSDVVEVIDAVQPDARVGFVELPNQSSQVLLHCGPASLAERRSALTELADALESDAMIPCSIFVSRAFKSPAEIAESLLTLALLSRSRQRLSAKRNLVIWGESPVQILLAGLPEQVVRWFTEAADSLHVLPPELNAELREAMTGLIAANLNVSEAARTMYVHRNTLINRLERIRESSGYDLRTFTDALVMWLRLILSDER